MVTLLRYFSPPPLRHPCQLWLLPGPKAPPVRSESTIRTTRTTTTGMTTKTRPGGGTLRKTRRSLKHSRGQARRSSRITGTGATTIQMIRGSKVSLSDEETSENERYVRSVTLRTGRCSGAVPLVDFKVRLLNRTCRGRTTRVFSADRL